MTWLFGGSAARSAEFDDALAAFERSGKRGPGTDRWLERGAPDVMAERQTFYEAHPWRVFRAQLDQRLERTETRTRLRWTMLFSGLGFATSVAVILLVATRWVPAPQVEPLPAPLDGIQMKGGDASGPVAPVTAPPRLIVQADGVELVDGATIAWDAELVFLVDSVGWDHVIVFGVEEDGTVTPYYPEEADGQSLLIGQGQALRLPDSVILDGTPGNERFVAVLSSAPLPWVSVEAAWAGTGDGGLPAMSAERVEALGLDGALGLEGTREVSVWFVKRPR